MARAYPLQPLKETQKSTQLDLPSRSIGSHTFCNDKLLHEVLSYTCDSILDRSFSRIEVFYRDIRLRSVSPNRNIGISRG